jgi:DNA-binding NtrC family response regulator
VETADELLSATAVQAAVVDLRLGGEMAFDLLDRLADRRVPAVLVTGYDRKRSLRPIGRSSLSRSPFARMPSLKH